MTGLQYVGTIQKWTTVVLEPPSGTFLKDSGEGKYSQCEELRKVHLVVHFAWKEKWPYVQLYTNSRAVTNP